MRLWRRLGLTRSVRSTTVIDSPVLNVFVGQGYVPLLILNFFNSESAKNEIRLLMSNAWAGNVENTELRIPMNFWEKSAEPIVEVEHSDQSTARCESDKEIFRCVVNSNSRRNEQSHAAVRCNESVLERLAKRTANGGPANFCP